MGGVCGVYAYWVIAPSFYVTTAVNEVLRVYL